MKKLLNNSIILFIMGIILMIIIPLPPFFLDLMFIINITLSVIILLTTMYIKEALEFSVFPSLLLITTLFRLSLNISSTRLILTNDGNAGAVIETFGHFVLQGNAVVGFIVFLIIVLVQFLVITKGAERIAEVTARFTLDAMPGKQMAIDADLNSGMITEEQAKLRRSNVQREADFYGAMDGATKFVKGDSIMSIIITAINFTGGVIIGLVQGGGTFTDVLSTYTIATVGDGLVSQIPALLISTATSMIVTRAASESSLNVDLAKQFKSQPTVLVISGIVLLALAMIPGFPKLQVIPLSAILIFLGVGLINNATVEKEREKNNSEVSIGAGENVGVGNVDGDYFKNIDNIYELIQIEPIEMEVGFSLIPVVDASSGGNFIDRVVTFRKQFAQEMGMVIPSVKLKDNGFINPNEYIIKIKGEEVARGDILPDYYLALDPGNATAEIEGIETIEPAYGIPSKWITKERREIAEIYGYTVIDSLSVLITHLSEIIREHSNELLTRQDLIQLLENVKKVNPVIVDEVIPGILSQSNLQKILGNLLREGVPIKDMETILETIGDYGTTVKSTDVLTEHVRQALKRTITRKWSKEGQIKVITISNDIENEIVNHLGKNEKNVYLNINPELMQNVVGQLVEQITKVRDEVESPIILTSPFVRSYFRKMVDQFYPKAVVLSYSEIESNVQIQAIGSING